MEQKCRVCNSETEEVLDLGEMYPSDFIRAESEGYAKYPLSLVRCKECMLVQLNGEVEVDDMYRQYWYRSGLNRSMINDLKDVATSTISRLGENTDTNDIWLDIGCNDCTLFDFVPSSFTKIGFDPALNLFPSGGFDFLITDYFTKERYEYADAKVITSIAMFYDLPDPNKFVEDIKEVLHKDGIWVVQFTDLFSMLSLNAFDNICHEHLEYYSLMDVFSLLEKHGLSVFDAEYNKVNGGSLRVYACHPGVYKPTSSLIASLLLESDFLSSERGSMEEFKKNIEKVRKDLLELLVSLKNKRVFILGASTKGNTLLQYCGIDTTLVQLAAEVNQDKFGLKTIGTEIPIISETEALAKNPDYFLCLPWHFKDMLVDSLEDYLDRGGKFIFPLPEITIVSKDGEVKWNQ